MHTSIVNTAPVAGMVRGGARFADEDAATDDAANS